MGRDSPPLHTFVWLFQPLIVSFHKPGMATEYKFKGVLCFFLCVLVFVFFGIRCNQTLSRPEGCCPFLVSGIFSCWYELVVPARTERPTEPLAADLKAIQADRREIPSEIPYSKYKFVDGPYRNGDWGFQVECLIASCS